MGAGSDLVAVEARLRAILAPYEDRLEPATVYGIPVLRRPGANAHQWFAFVKPATKHVGFYLLPIHEWDDLRETIPPGLRRRLTGRSAFDLSRRHHRLRRRQPPDHGQQSQRQLCQRRPEIS